MWLKRPNWVMMLAIVGTLLPASFVAAATRVIDIFIEARNFSSSPSGVTVPVDPVLAAFQFQFDESLLTNGTGVVDVAPTQAILNFDSFDPADFLGHLIIFNGVVALGPGTQISTQYPLTPGTDGFFYSGFFSNTQSGNVRYTTSGSGSVFDTWNYNCFFEPTPEEPCPEINIVVTTQSRVSDS